MHLASTIVAVLLAAGLLASGSMKLRRTDQSLAQMGAVRVPERIVPLLGALEIAAALGLVIGIWWQPLAVAAAIGSTIYFIGALVAHRRARDPHFQAALVFLVVSVAALILEILR